MMATCDKLLQKATNNPTGLRLNELCRLAECYGFIHARTRGSHHIFKCPGRKEVVNLQPDKNGKAKPYQVRQILAMIAETSTNER